MELEELQVTWSELSDQLEKQKKLTKVIIMQMTQDRYSRKFQTILKFETFGTVVCFVMALALLVNFNKLDNWYSLISGVFTLSFLILLPILVLRSLNRLKNLNIRDKNYKETLIEFVGEKKRILKIQKVAAYLCLPLMFTALVVSAKIFSNKNFITMEKSLSLYLILVVTFIVAAFFARWGYNYYKKITSSAENILKEIE